MGSEVQRDEVSWQAIKSLPNVRCIRSVAHREIPAILQNADALLLPYNLMGGKVMFPAKLMEYVAAAKPILAFSMMTINGVQPPTLDVCDSAADMVRRLKLIGDGKLGISQEVKNQCRQMALDNSWDSRAMEFMKVIQATEAIKRS